MLRNIFAFLLAPFPAAAIMAAMVAIAPQPGRAVFEHPASMFAAVCLFVYVLALLLAVPAAAWLRRREAFSLRVHAFTGTAIALVGIGLVALWDIAKGRNLPVSGSTAIGVAAVTIFGLLCGATYWVIARPDRRAALGKGRAGRDRLLKTFE